MWNLKLIEVRNRMVVTRGWSEDGEKGMGRGTNGTNLQLDRSKRFCVLLLHKRMIIDDNNALYNSKG
jgi:hypothetical protein